MRKQIHTNEVATPKSPYSQAIVARGTFVFLSGVGPTDPATGDPRLGSFREQAELTFENIGKLLQAAGSSWANVVKVSAFLADFSNFPEYNDVYRKYFREPYPARTTVQAGIGKIAIEVDCIALVPEN